MNWFKKLEICRKCKCVCVCKNNVIIRHLSKRLSIRRTVKLKVPEFLSEWKKQLDLNNKEEMEMYKMAYNKWEQQEPIPKRSL